MHRQNSGQSHCRRATARGGLNRFGAGQDGFWESDVGPGFAAAA
jgi:hypothetical protein